MGNKEAGNVMEGAGGLRMLRRPDPRREKAEIMTQKRDIFVELAKGFDALQQQRKGKLTLRTGKGQGARGKANPRQFCFPRRGECPREVASVTPGFWTLPADQSAYLGKLGTRTRRT